MPELRARAKKLASRYLVAPHAAAHQQIQRHHLQARDRLLGSRSWALTANLRLLAFRLKALAKRLRNALQPAAGLAERRSPPLITVAIPVVAASRQLTRSIQSVLTQTLPRFELLLVVPADAGPEREEIARYLDHPQVRLIQPSPTQDWVDAAVRAARGQYLTFQHPDHVACPERLERTAATLEAHGVDVTYGSWAESGAPAPELPLEHELADPALASRLPVWSAAFRIDAFRRVHGTKPDLAPFDWAELWSRMARHGFRFKRLGARLFEGPVPVSPQPDPTTLATLMRESRRLRPVKPRIAYLIPGKGISGGTAVVCQHLKRLQQRGYDVLLLDVNEDSRALDWFPDLRLEIIPFSKRPRYLDVAVATGWQTVHYLDLLEEQRRFYFVQSDETRFTEDPGLKAYIRETYARPYEYLTEARWIQRWLADEFGQEAAYVPNGLDPDIISPAEPLEPKGTRLRVLLEGPIAIPFKGMADAFKAVQDLDCEVWCVSSHGEPQPDWRCDRFFSAVPMTEMKRIYSSCDILLKMSRVEGFFGPPMEMMACGGVSVVSQVTGYDEYIVADQNALVVEPGDVAGATAAVQRLLTDGALRARLQEAGMQTAARWRWEPSIDSLEQLLLPSGRTHSRKNQ